MARCKAVTTTFRCASPRYAGGGSGGGGGTGSDANGMDANDQDDSQTAPYVTDEDEAGMSGSGNIGGGDANDAASNSPTPLNDKAPAAPGRDEKQQQRSSLPSPHPPSSPSSAGSQRRRKKKRRTRLRGRGPDPRRGKRPTVAEPATAPLAPLAQSGRAPDCASSSRVKENAPGAAAQYSTLMWEAVLLPVVDSPQGGNPCTKGSWRLGATSLQMSQPRHKSEYRNAL